MKEAGKRSSMAITATRKMYLERLAINASYKAKRPITWTDLVNFLIDEYTEEASKDLISRYQIKKEK